MTRRKRADSGAMQAAALRQAAEGIEPPPQITLSEDERVWWDQIVATKLDWTPNDLIVAAQLARVYRDIEHYADVVRDGRRIDPDGAKVAAAHKILHDLTGDVVRLSRLLHVHPTATQGRGDQQAKRNTLNREARATVEKLGGLIARPTVQ